MVRNSHDVVERQAMSWETVLIDKIFGYFLGAIERTHTVSIFSTMDIGFSIQDIVNRIWWFIDDIDHLMYDAGSGFHIVHFPKDVIERCYSCDIGKFPKIPDFPMRAVTSFASCVG